ncbi:glycoside hydrolase family 15 protein [Nannocystis radixulma]|uniref:Glycoside hydrolase family 15 protein n=1 Tax=Nannocystis radixulma TaxID=2995305 RepID=A0ABT5BEQ4_9BACT|nr:glycoside hydrolase family 15 protein [Nannocystis radixulma]MDC0671903.1 glycoside hydrolase family 15 protein [Nannocystis radixulma]
MSRKTSSVALVAALVSTSLAASASAAEPQRTRYKLPSSNGWGALLVDLSEGHATELREHVFAAEEPQIDAQGQDIWDGEQFATIHTRNVLYDAYFGVRAEGDQFWLTSAPVDQDASGYVGWNDLETVGTGIVAIEQPLGALEATTFAFAPQGLEAAGMVLLLRLKNTGAQPLQGVQAFSLHNFHLGFGRAKRPWDVYEDIAANGETVEFVGGAEARFRERGFAGTIVTRALTPIVHRGVGPNVDLFGVVAQSQLDLPDNAAPANAVDDAITAFQWDVGTIMPGAEAWVGIAAIHRGDPFAGAEAETMLDAWIDGVGPQVMLARERNVWADIHAATKLPDGLSAPEVPMLRQAVAMLHMGQVLEDRSFAREWLSQDGEPRRTRFLGLDDQPATLPAWIKHRGHGAVLASLPPGEWTYAWIRDGAYATAAMAALGMQEHSRAALNFYLDAEAGRFQQWSELQPYAMPPYQISLVRYHGFGVEETDFNAFGPNLEFDGFGLFLWALRAYEVLTGDTSLADARWEEIATEVADVLVALVDPETGMIRADSSIWETHWLGRERRFTYTSITAARGLCDAAAIAERRGDAARADMYRKTGESIRAAIAAHATDGERALAGSVEELATGEGYFDAAVWDAVAMGLFDPQGPIAQATFAAIDEHLRVDAGPGWSRNDDRWDHANMEDATPWGSDYDSAEWVITDLRGSVALRAGGQEARADALIEWVRAQAATNYFMTAETFDEQTGTYKFNAPMLGFGAGAYALALAHRAGALTDPACGAYFVEDEAGTTGADTGDSTSSTGAPDTTTAVPTTGGATTDATTETATTTMGMTSVTSAGTATAGLTDGSSSEDGCGCTAGTSGAPAALLLGLGLRRRRRRA